MLIEITPPLMIVKHTCEGSIEPYHTFEVWEVPADVQDLFDRARVASDLKRTFEGGFAAARDECRQFLDRECHEVPTLWIEKSVELCAVGEAV